MGNSHQTIGRSHFPTTIRLYIRLSTELQTIPDSTELLNTLAHNYGITDIPAKIMGKNQKFRQNRICQ